MDAYYLLIAFVRCGPNGIEYAIHQPPLQELPHLQVVGIEDESAVPIRHRPRQLLGHFLARLAVERGALSPHSRLNAVAAHVESVFAPGDAALAVTTPAHT